MSVRIAAQLLLERDPAPQLGADLWSIARASRQVVFTAPSGAQIVALDYIAGGLDEDRHRNVLCVGGHSGRNVDDYIRCLPAGIIGSDGGMGKDRAGAAGIWVVQKYGLAAASVAAATARLGDGLSTYQDGVISACNDLAAAKGVRVGQRARHAARRLLDAPP